MKLSTQGRIYTGA